MPRAVPCALLQLSEPRAPNVAGDAWCFVHPKCCRECSKQCVSEMLQGMLRALCTPNVVGNAQFCAYKLWQGMLRTTCAPNVAGDAQSSVHLKCGRGCSVFLVPAPRVHSCSSPQP